MRKNKTMRLAALLLVLTLITSCFVGGTFAKYATSATNTDTARVAYWGFNDNAATVTFNLFASDTTETGLESINGVKLLAPGTKGESAFAFVNAKGNDAPEVDYQVKITLDGTTDSIGDLDNEIVWKLNGNVAGTNGTWAELKAAILALSGDSTGTKTYEAGTAVPAALANNAENKISWEWKFQDGTSDEEKKAADAADTALGNAATLQEVTLAIQVAVTQVD